MAKAEWYDIGGSPTPFWLEPNGIIPSPNGLNYGLLIGGLEHFFHILGIIIPTDFHIFQRGRSTTNQFNCGLW